MVEYYKYYMQWVVTGLLHDSFASVHATVFNCLVGMPNAMISGKEDMCAWSSLCCIPGSNTYRKYMSSMCNNLYGIIIILFHGIPGIETCTCAYVTHSSERFVRDC
jgi:hypothetical protein